MADLVPYPFSGLVSRMFRELERNQRIFDLPAARFFTGDPERDFSVRFHGRRASSPLGPAAGPQTQMAQNIVLSWLGGSRIMELKTVQVKDDLEIPRPCIDMQTVGLNAEWSQELRIHESLDEYVKGAMLVEMLRAGDAVPQAPHFGDVIYDMSLGYDLAGIKSEKIRGFIRGMMDASETIERFRAEIPAAHARLRDLEYPARLSNTMTLSTFHGCPPNEIEGIIDHLMREYGLNCVVKFNPMLLGKDETRRLLHDVLGYTDIRVPDSAFARDTTWEQAVEMMERLGATADSLGLSLGAKFSNTLIVENTRGFLPASEKEVYLSGPPLHVLAVNLVKRFRDRFGDRFPVSFAAGIEWSNFAEVAALGLVPITTCSDLLQPQGYGRLFNYNRDLSRKMAEAGAATLDDYVIRAFGKGEEALGRLGLAEDDPRLAACRKALAGGESLREAAGDLYEPWVSAARLANTDRYVPLATRNPRYAKSRNQKPPRKIGRSLVLFDCLTCDKCVPVCPNDANFTFRAPEAAVPVEKLVRNGGGWIRREEGSTPLTEDHQIANFADFCNECGNCDVFCPEDGGPYAIKPRFFGSEADWRRFADHDGFYLERRDGRDLMLGRFGGAEFRLEAASDEWAFSGEGFSVRFSPTDPNAPIEGEGPPEIDLTYCHIMDAIRRGILDTDEVNAVNALWAVES
jgi:putative selenate reductase